MHGAMNGLGTIFTLVFPDPEPRVDLPGSIGEGEGTGKVCAERRRSRLSI
jgi:hypothetical protein